MFYDNILMQRMQKICWYHDLSGQADGGLHGSLCHGQDGAQGDERVDHISRRTTKIGMDMKTKVDP